MLFLVEPGVRSENARNMWEFLNRLLSPDLLRLSILGAECAGKRRRWTLITSSMVHQSICLAEGLPSTPFGFSVGRVMPYARPAADIAYVVIIKRSAVRAAQCRSLSIEGCAILSFGKVFTQRNGLLAVAAGNVEVPFACLDSLTHAAYQTTVRFAQEWLCLKVMHLECSFLGRAHQTTFNALLHSRH